MLLLLALLPVCGCVPARQSLPAAPESTGIVGVVRDPSGRPAGQIFVYAYRHARHGLRGPADFEAQTDADGRYFLDLAAGSYFLVARERSGGESAGPPRPGDAWATHPANPVPVRAGEVSRGDLTLQRGTMPIRVQEGVPAVGDTGVTGRLVDAGGKALPGAFVLGYRGEEGRRMPDISSAAVGGDGRFQLLVPNPGRWCLAARTRTRGQPRPGELYGRVETGEGSCRDLAPGEMLEVGDIVLRPFQR